VQLGQISLVCKLSSKQMLVNQISVEGKKQQTHLVQILVIKLATNAPQISWSALALTQQMLLTQISLVLMLG
jgi:hypothetical protein